MESTKLFQRGVDSIPPGARCAARVIILDQRDRVLYFHAQEPKSGARFWIMPGGGLEAGESFEAAACREVMEETGIALTLGPFVWFRRHQHIWNDQPADQYEKFFLARINSSEIKIAGGQMDTYLIGHRWWSLDELVVSKEDFAPREVARHLKSLLAGDIPKEPIDCGI